MAKIWKIESCNFFTAFILLSLVCIVTSRDRREDYQRCSQDAPKSSCLELCKKMGSYPVIRCYETLPDKDFYDCICDNMNPNLPPANSTLCTMDLEPRCRGWCEGVGRLQNRCLQVNHFGNVIPTSFACICDVFPPTSNPSAFPSQ